MKGVYVLYKPKVWGVKGPFVSDYVISDASGRVFFTIDEFEIALAPEPEPVSIADYSVRRRIVTTWQREDPGPRVLDLDPADSTARAVDTKLSNLLATHRFAVDCFAAGVDGEPADANVDALQYPMVALPSSIPLRSRHRAFLSALLA